MRRLRQGLKYLMAALYVLAGVNHFLNPALYLKIMPPYLPWPRFLVEVSGVCEIALGLLLLVPRCTRWAAWGLIALLIAVFPANLHMAVHPELYPEIPAAALWARLPLQAVLIAWAYVYTRSDTPSSHGVVMPESA
ncbi:MAG TPA: MauE/DoxX family redox-associated membrane protein [Thermoanaerobaculia bacterium]|nr:MauE/DoxX family redox-associated membrane protein [Thermoanaerobaculia bacterium]